MPDKPITLTSPEACKVLREVQERFDEWANERIGGCEDAMEVMSSKHEWEVKAAINAYEFSMNALTRIIREISAATGGGK